MSANNYAHLNANATTVLANTSCILAGVTINTKGATANTLTLYDNTAGSGAVIAVIDTTANVGFIQFQNILCKNGLTAVIASGTAADVTIAFG
jgi:hypothetical protein